MASHQGMNLPGVEAVPAAVDDSDLDWVDFAVDHGVDLLAVSFVRSAATWTRSTRGWRSAARTSL